MVPLPTQTTVAAFVGALLMLLFGVAFSSAISVISGGVILVALASAFTLSLPLGARLRRERLELTWWHAHAETGAARGSVVSGVPFEVHVSLRHYGQRRLVLSELLPTHGNTVRCVRGGQADLILPPRTRSEFNLAFVAAGPGRVVLHGLSVAVQGPFDLFRAPLYFPIPLVIQALPHSMLELRTPLRSSVAVAVERAGLTQRRRRGGGSDLREIRELMPGDPFKSIAWKSSAKAGKWMVREVESEVQETLYLVLDIGGSMRGGEPGTRKLDHGIELSALLAQRALEDGDRVGLITVDTRVVAHAPAREGQRQMALIHEALLHATEIVDQDLTEPDDDEVTALAARYIRHQDGVDHRTKTGVDLDALARHAAAALSAEREHRSSTPDVVASDRVIKLLRRFCRARGIALRYRPEGRSFAKSSGLSKALKAAASNSRVPRSLLVITDFDGLFQPELLVATLRMLRAQQHVMTFVFPDARALGEQAPSHVVGDLQWVYGLAEERRLREAYALLGKLGIPLFVSSPREIRRVTRAELAKRVA
ncbi:MAG TPA: DUF58 domain-containing protein [Polyangiales bacterium]|nr:DUF58 domain-containing protein [Polyangiales bacterium]